MDGESEKGGSVSGREVVNDEDFKGSLEREDGGWLEGYLTEAEIGRRVEDVEDGIVVELRPGDEDELVA